MQNLDTDLRGASSLKDGATEVRFGTGATNPSEIGANDRTRKMGLVLWLDRDDVDNALKAAKTTQWPHQ